MKHSLFFIFILVAVQAIAQEITLNANGQGNTYDLITSVLAPGANPIEVPDCGHEDFGEHIDEVFDAEQDSYVFRFHLHTAHDDDRCIRFDRQRNEIKTYAPSPDNLKGVEEENVIYKWKFKLSEGFQTSPNFTHLHQIKSVGGDYASIPIYTLTARKSNPDRIELRYALLDDQITLTQVPIAPFIDNWISVTERITYGVNGYYEITIVNEETGAVLLQYTDDAIVNWRPGAEFVRPKWGIYRSLLNAQDLRDETVLYTDFSIEEVESLAVDNVDTLDQDIRIYRTDNSLHVDNIPTTTTTIEIYSIIGKKVMEQKVLSPQAVIDVSQLSKGNYILNLIGTQQRLARKFVIY